MYLLNRKAGNLQTWPQESSGQVDFDPQVWGQSVTLSFWHYFLKAAKGNPGLTGLVINLQS